MPAYSFSLPQFEKMIPYGVKTRTTRLYKDGKRFEQAKKAMTDGRPAQLYWKQRTKECRLLLETPMVEVERVKIYPAAQEENNPTLDEIKYNMMLERNGRLTSYAERNQYAREEGFDSSGGLAPWEAFLEALFRLHGLDVWKEQLYTIRWPKPKVVE